MAKVDLIVAAQQLGIELTGKETVAQLEELIKGVTDSNSTGTSEHQNASTSTGGKTSFDVFNADGVFVRTYTLEIHGENAEALANEFASHTGGTVK